MRVKDTGGWWRIVIDYGAKSAKFCLGEGERGAIPTSASNSKLPRRNKLQNPEELSASESASEIKTGQYSAIARQILVKNAVTTHLACPKTWVSVPVEVPVKSKPE